MANYTEKPKKKKTTSRDIALDKLDFYNAPTTKSPQKQDKIKGRPKNVFARFCESAFPQKGDSSTEKIRKIVLLAAIVVFAVTIAILLFQLISIDDGDRITSSTQSLAGVHMGTLDMDDFDDPTVVTPIPGTTTGTSGSEGDSVPVEEETEEINVTPVVNKPLNVNFDALKAENPDTVAWIKITSTYLNEVVVKGEDNDEYLHTGFDGSESVSGTIFAHHKNKMDGTDQNIILFGHNMLNGDRFASVKYYLPNDASREPIAFYKVHPTVMLATPNGGSETYKIFAGVLANTQSQYGEVFKYTNKTKFKSQDDFYNFILEVMDRSWFYTDVDLRYGDQLLTLSTCIWPLGEEIETRWVVFARKVRPGESEYVDTSVATRNYNAKLFDYYYNMIGGQWYGRNWDTSKLIGYKKEDDDIVLS
ncbi:MAG: class B sortase [Oscillospiraceae bacterium]|nr:class B sortase [Oscillospiraceae bacterium]